MSETIQQVLAAGTPEALFGSLSGTAVEQLGTVRRRFRDLAREVHPDRHANSPESTRAFAHLHALWQAAQQRIEAGTYGHALFTLVTKMGAYEAVSAFARGDCSDLYWGRSGAESVLIKLARDPRDRDLLENEARLLKRLAAGDGDERLRLLYPALRESFQAAGRAVNVFSAPSRPLVPLTQVVRAYPAGIDPRDMVWMWKRALLALGYAHSLGTVHGAVTPDHLLLDLADHGAVVCGWTAGCLAGSGETIPVMSPGWESLYPPEVADRIPPTPATDLYMLAGCICRLLGGEGAPPPTTPAPLARLLRACLIPTVPHRLDNAQWLHDEIDGLLNRLFGPRVFRPFALPEEVT